MHTYITGKQIYFFRENSISFMQNKESLNNSTREIIYEKLALRIYMQRN